ncbi:hypothetical protein [Actinomadura sp. 3N407]|uniref:hypothetical protein n=1 Tax=Actinomadura sp. 3N407 TaxID=3457423 RepID=UPI003FCE44D4
MFKLLWLPVFWAVAAIIAYEWNLNGVFLVVALGVGTAAALWATSGDSNESGQ